MKKIAIALFCSFVLSWVFVVGSINKDQKNVGNMRYCFNQYEEKEETENQNSDMAIDKAKLARQITDELNKEIGVPTIFIHPNKRKKIALINSKFGGLPYWDKSVPYPTDKNGNKLKLLAQFNLNEISEACNGEVGLLPKEGILQFFLLSGNDYLYGSDLNDYTNNNRFRVVYHSIIDPNITVEDIQNLCIPISSSKLADDYEPITGEIGLDFSVRKTASPHYGEFKEIFLKKAALYGWQIAEKPPYYDLYHCLGEDVCYELDEYACQEENCLLGYPVYTQLGDPRLDEERYAKYDTQLFQMVSYNENGTKFMAIWGDMGIAHFFINHKNLIEKDFSDIMYYWDCS